MFFWYYFDLIFRGRRWANTAYSARMHGLRQAERKRAAQSTTGIDGSVQALDAEPEPKVE
jgi:hypothetical protein